MSFRSRSTMPKGCTARPPEPLEVGEGVGMWIDHATLAALKSERRWVMGTAR